MSDISIRVENLGKLYRIGQYIGYQILRETLTDAFSAPFRRSQVNREETETHSPVSSNPSLSTLDSQSPAPDSPYIWALKDVSFEMKRGEVVGIIGRNGAGKTTLLKVLSRITNPTEGYAEIHGRVGSLLEVGTGFHSELTGRENIYLNGAVMGMKRAEVDRKFDDIVEFAGVEKFLDTPLKRYSSGMRVRLAFAVAAHLEPEILLVDEVLAVGDYEFQKKCLGKMGEVSQEGLTVLMVSHNMQSIASLCQRAIMLDGGKVAADGPADQVINTYITSQKNAPSEMVWTDPAKAPGDHRVRLNSIRILSENREPAAELDLSKDIIIQVNYWCMKDGAWLTPGVLIYNQMGVDIFESNPVTGISADPDKPCDFPHKVGLYQLEFRLPANLLNEGTYGVGFGFYGVRLVGKEDELLFHVYDSGSNPKPDGRRWRGVIRANVVWGSAKYLGK